MTEKELKKLNRYQLLEMLIIQTERAEELKNKLEEAQKQLDSREVEMTVMGSIAEAALHLNGGFEAASRAEAIIKEAKRQAQQILLEAQKR